MFERIGGGPVTREFPGEQEMHEKQEELAKLHADFEVAVRKFHAWHGKNTTGEERYDSTGDYSTEEEGELRQELYSLQKRIVESMEFLRGRGWYQHYESDLKK